MAYKTFQEWIKDKRKYNALFKTLYTKPGFEDYRHISHEEVVRLASEIEFDYPRQVMIPKDAFSEREVFLYEPKSNLILKFYNNYLNEVFADDISSSVYSYKEGLSVARALQDFNKKFNPAKIYVKVDLSNYFMTPHGKLLETFLDRYGLTNEPYNKLFQNKFYAAKTRELSEKNLGLLPGAPISAFLSNAFLKPFDDYMNSMYDTYVRYSDDFIVESPTDDYESVVRDITRQLHQLGLVVNQKKTLVFRPGDKPIFLGSEFSAKGYELTDKRFVKMKQAVKRLAEKTAKEPWSKEERIRKFLRRVYKYFFGNIISDIYRGGVCASWFSCSSLYNKMQLMDYYILDKCRYVYSGRTNFGALKAGINTEYLESQGFISLVTVWHQYKENPLTMALNMFIRINDLAHKTKENRYHRITPGTPKELDFMDVLMTGSKGAVGIESWRIDPYRNKITRGLNTLFDDDVSAYDYTDSTGKTCRIAMQDYYGEMEAEKFFEIFRLTSYKSCDYQKTLTSLFNPVKSHRLPYYSYLDISKGDAVQMAAGLLFLHNTGRLTINFKDTDNACITYETPEIRFAIPNVRR